MVIDVQIPDPLATQVAALPHSRGSSPEAFVLAAITTVVDPLATLDASLAPVREAFRASGMTEDAAVELFEAEKHALRRERHVGGP
ncbi:MAG: hypothetical protein ACRCT8_16400 [Lacipirellulaceae bacterium]